MAKMIWGVLALAGTALAVSTCTTSDKMMTKMDWGQIPGGGTP